MGRIRRIKVRLMQPKSTPQCCVPMRFSVYLVHGGYLDDRKKKCAQIGYDYNNCLSSSSYEIDGKNYCTKHAGMRALDILAEDG